MAKKIIGINLSAAKNYVCQGYCAAFLEHAKESPVVMQHCEPQVGVFETRVDAYVDCMKNHRFNLLTTDVSAQDVQRDKWWTAALAVISASMTNTDPTIRRAAENIDKVFRSFGPIRNLPYLAQSPAMSDLCDDLINSHSADLETIGLKPLIENLAAVNELFMKTYDERTHAKTDHINGETRAAKAAMIEAYRVLVMCINASVYQHPEVDFSDFIDYANTLISEYRPLIGQKPVSPEEVEEEEEVADEELEEEEQEEEEEEENQDPEGGNQNGGNQDWDV